MGKSRRECFCGERLKRGESEHPDCANAWGLDYNPTSAADATAWIAARRRLFASLTVAPLKHGYHRAKAGAS